MIGERSAFRIRERVSFQTGSEGAKQSMKDECDVNTILARYAKTGLLTPVTTMPQAFVDVSEIGDYRSALENVRQAGELFMQLPAHIRARFGNDAAMFLDFATDPANVGEMRKMGMLPKEQETPVEAPEPPTPSEEAEKVD